jgi:hypothetical protein
LYRDYALQRTGQHPAAMVHQLTPRVWKPMFADNPPQSDLHEVNRRVTVGQITRLSRTLLRLGGARLLQDNQQPMHGVHEFVRLFERKIFRFEFHDLIEFKRCCFDGSHRPVFEKSLIESALLNLNFTQMFVYLFDDNNGPSNDGTYGYEIAVARRAA